MGHYIIDTNVISDFLTESFSDFGMDFMKKIINDEPKISFITQIELLSWKTDLQTENYIKEFILICQIINISQDIIEKCIATRRTKNIRTPDALIAATALSFGCTIITNNIKDFSNIKGLKCINPYNL